MRYLLILTAFIWPQMAQAVAITNLSDHPQQVTQGFIEPTDNITIAPGETWRVEGKRVLRFHGNEVHAEPDEEYAIWNDDTFGPQKRHTHAGGIFP